MLTNNIEEYKSQTLKEIQSKYIKDTFKFFCYELNKTHNDPNQIVELVNKQIDTRIYGIGLIHDWRVKLKDPITKQQIRDITLNNILEDSLQYNYKSYYDINASNALKFPYLYKVYTERSLRGNAGPNDLPFGADGGNWVYNYKNGILFFSDFNNLAQKNDYGGIYNITNNNKPVISVYKYIGKKILVVLLILWMN